MSDSIPRRKSAGPPRQWWLSTTVRTSVIAALALTGIAAHLALRFLSDTSPALRDLPLYIVLAAGGVPLVLSLALKLVRRQFGSDLLAGISIVTAVLLGEYLAGALVVLMLSGGEALEAFALGRASSVLQALARRMPLVAHRRADSHVAEVPLDDVPHRRRADRLPARDLPRRRRRHRRPRRDGRVVSHRRAVHDAEGARLGGVLRRHQRRKRADRCAQAGWRSIRAMRAS